MTGSVRGRFSFDKSVIVLVSGLAQPWHCHSFSHVQDFPYSLFKTDATLQRGHPNPGFVKSMQCQRQRQDVEETAQT
jgi:hypothetical protein